MKKIYLTLIGACFALGASAQFEWNIRSGEWQVDSMYTIDKETGERMVTDVYEYNSDGTLAVTYSTSLDYDYLYNGYVTERTKNVFTYDNGHLTHFESFWLKGNDWVIMAKMEMSDHDTLGNPRTIVYYEADDDDEGQMLMSTKWEVTRWGTYEPADFKLYQIDFGTWELYNTTVSELNEQGLVVKQTHTSMLFGTENVSTDTYEYDEHGYVTKQVSMSDFGTHVDTYVNIYDANGNMLTANNAYAQVSFTYDNAGRMLSETLNGKTTGYAYDIKNRKVTKTYPSGRTIVEDYDLRQRMSGIKENNNYFVTLAYNANDFLTQRAYGNGTTTSYVYNSLNQLVQLTDSPSIAQVQMTYDAVGNMLSKKDLLRPNKSEAYSYDALNRLASFKQGEITTGAEIPNPLKQVQYNLDALGNRTTVTTNGVTTNYTADNMNAYTSIIGGQNMTPQYDDNGNLTNDGTHTYQYNYNNRLISVDNGVTATYKYDALNRRIQKVVVGPVETTTNYYYSGDQAIEERDAADAVQATCVFGISVDDVLQMQRGGNTYYYHKNHLGSVVALTDGSGNLMERYEYDPYGQPTILDANDNVLSQSAVGNSILFTGRDYDAETGLYYYRARTMHPGLGRFMQHDTLMYVDGMNMYSYVGSAPLLFIDSYGLDKTNFENISSSTGPYDPYAFGCSTCHSTQRIEADRGVFFDVVSNSLGPALSYLQLGSNGKIYGESFYGNQYISVGSLNGVQLAGSIIGYIGLGYGMKGFYDDLINSQSDAEFMNNVFGFTGKTVGELLGGELLGIGAAMLVCGAVTGGMCIAVGALGGILGGYLGEGFGLEIASAFIGDDCQLIPRVLDNLPLNFWSPGNKL